MHILILSIFLPLTFAQAHTRVEAGLGVETLLANDLLEPARQHPHQAAEDGQQDVEAGCMEAVITGSLGWCFGTNCNLFTSAADDPSVSQSVFTITEKDPTRSFSSVNRPKIGLQTLVLNVKVVEAAFNQEKALDYTSSGFAKVCLKL